jgi:endoglucanase
MNHFSTKDGMNIFRLPVGWQYIVGGQLGGTLNSANLQKYDQLVQGCLKTGAICIIDIHNYARWNGKIIGQGGPTNAQFVNLWTQIATKYKNTANVAFGVMNEPHEVDITEWAATVQLVVTAIRNAGAKTQMSTFPLDQVNQSLTLLSPVTRKQLHLCWSFHFKRIRRCPSSHHKSRQLNYGFDLRCSQIPR